MPLRFRTASALAALSLVFTPPVHSQDAEGHLLAGARHFRAGAYGQALVEFQVAAAAQPAGAARWYVAAAFQKLGRAEEAVETFELAENAFPAGRDDVLQLYWALACYEARLFHCAVQRADRVAATSGPRIGARALELRAKVSPLFTGEPPAVSIDWYLARGRTVAQQGRATLARAYLAEAQALAKQRADHHGLDSAERELAALRKSGAPR